VIGVVLLTDGQHNHGPAPGAAARLLGERGVPIFPVVLGDRQPPRCRHRRIAAARRTTFTKGLRAVWRFVSELPDYLRVNMVSNCVPERPSVTHPAQRATARNAAVHHASGSGIAIDKKIIQHDGKDQVYELVFPVKMDVVGRRTLDRRRQRRPGGRSKTPCRTTDGPPPR
jgi:hypothetical protein